ALKGKEEPQTADPSTANESPRKRKKGKKRKKNEVTAKECTVKDIDELFDAAEEKVVNDLKERYITDQAHAVAEAFKDDDVIGDFEEEKEFVSCRTYGDHVFPISGTALLKKVNGRKMSTLPYKAGDAG
ncbi:hypothetical protein OESDEN_18392, partial [Oesophagostomum dentatum]